MTKTIEIVVKPDGSTSLETKGFAGSECRDASGFLELALGVRESERLTSAFHAGAATTSSNQLRTQS